MQGPDDDDIDRILDVLDGVGPLDDMHTHAHLAPVSSSRTKQTSNDYQESKRPSWLQSMFDESVQVTDDAIKSIRSTAAVLTDESMLRATFREAACTEKRGFIWDNAAPDRQYDTDRPKQNGSYRSSKGSAHDPGNDDGAAPTLPMQPSSIDASKHGQPFVAASAIDSGNRQQSGQATATSRPLGSPSSMRVAGGAISGHLQESAAARPSRNQSSEGRGNRAAGKPGMTKSRPRSAAAARSKRAAASTRDAHSAASGGKPSRRDRDHAVPQPSRSMGLRRAEAGAHRKLKGLSAERRRLEQERRQLMDRMGLRAEQFLPASDQAVSGTDEGGAARYDMGLGSERSPEAPGFETELQAEIRRAREEARYHRSRADKRASKTTRSK